MSDQNESFDLNILREMFKSEAYELLGELENALLALEVPRRENRSSNNQGLQGTGTLSSACGYTC